MGWSWPAQQQVLAAAVGGHCSTLALCPPPTTPPEGLQEPNAVARAHAGGPALPPGAGSTLRLCSWTAAQGGGESHGAPTLALFLGRNT